MYQVALKNIISEYKYIKLLLLLLYYNAKIYDVRQTLQYNFNYNVKNIYKYFTIYVLQANSKQ